MNLIGSIIIYKNIYKKNLSLDLLDKFFEIYSMD